MNEQPTDDAPWAPALSRYSFEQIQDAFAKALLELTGLDYTVDIHSLTREGGGYETAGVRLRIRRAESEEARAATESVADAIAKR